MLNILSIDIGYKKPSFIIINYKNKTITNISIYNKIQIENIHLDVPCILNYFISKKINLVIIENQLSLKNVKLMSFIHGYFMAQNIETLIKQPIAYLRPDKSNSNRSTKKQFSVNCLNSILQKQLYNLRFTQNDSDICDSTNLALYYLHSMEEKLKKKKEQKKFISDFNISIDQINILEIEKNNFNTSRGLCVVKQNI